MNGGDGEEHVLPRMPDLHGLRVDVAIGANGEVWVNAEGACRFRAKGCTAIHLDDQRLPDLVRLVATRFVENMEVAIGPANLAEARRRNAAQPDPDICHTYDFCDANEVMQETLADFGVELFEEDEMTIQAMNLFDAAWSHADLRREKTDAG